MTANRDAVGDLADYRVLDAGCGRGHVVLDLPPNAHIVGIDVSQLALERNAMLNEAIVGDLQTYPLETNSFDEIVCWDVLEHLPRPDRAFANLAQALKPGGVLTIGVPNLLSAKGLITKFTPLRFHAWVYRHVFRSFQHAGEPGYGPWKTYLRWTIRPRGLDRMAAESRLEVDSNTVYAAASLRTMMDRRMIRLACRIVWPFGDPRLTECRFVARKPLSPRP
jgi:SAM-dependent methyltransferase